MRARTRPALAVAGERRGGAEDVAFARLALLAQGAPVPQAVADALGVREPSGRSLPEALAAAGGGGPCWTGSR